MSPTPCSESTGAVGLPAIRGISVSAGETRLRQSSGATRSTARLTSTGLVGLYRVVRLVAMRPGFSASRSPVVGAPRPNRKSFQYAKAFASAGRGPPDRSTAMDRNCLPRSLVVSGPPGTSPVRPNAAWTRGTTAVT